MTRAERRRLLHSVPSQGPRILITSTDKIRNRESDLLQSFDVLFGTNEANEGYVAFRPNDQLAAALAMGLMEKHIETKEGAA